VRGAGQQKTGLANGLEDEDGVAVGPEAAEKFVCFGVGLGLDEIEQVAQVSQAISLGLGLCESPLEGSFAAPVGQAYVVLAVCLEGVAAAADWLVAVALGRYSG
jgi:hypothetical protein